MLGGRLLRDWLWILSMPGALLFFKFLIMDFISFGLVRLISEKSIGVCWIKCSYIVPVDWWKVKICQIEHLRSTNLYNSVQTIHPNSPHNWYRSFDHLYYHFVYVFPYLLSKFMFISSILLQETLPITKTILSCALLFYCNVCCVVSESKYAR